MYSMDMSEGTRRLMGEGVRIVRRMGRQSCWPAAAAMASQAGQVGPNNQPFSSVDPSECTTGPCVMFMVSTELLGWTGQRQGPSFLLVRLSSSNAAISNLIKVGLGPYYNGCKVKLLAFTLPKSSLASPNPGPNQPKPNLGHTQPESSPSSSQTQFGVTVPSPIQTPA